MTLGTPWGHTRSEMWTNLCAKKLFKFSPANPLRTHCRRAYNFSTTPQGAPGPKGNQRTHPKGN